MAVAQGLLKQTVFAKQAGLGSAASTGGKIKRRSSSIFTLMRDQYESNEIVSHQQSTGANAGIIKTSGKLDALLSPATFSELFASLLRKDAAATSSATGVSLTIGAPTAGIYGLTRASGSWYSDGFKVGDIIRLSVGSLNAANLNKNLQIISITSATAATVKPVNGVALVAEGPITGCTVSVPGKKIWAPSSGHTNDYWSVEEWYSDLSKSELFTDVKIASADINLPATGNATVSFDCPGLARTRATSQAIASPAAETTTNVLTAVNGLIVVNGVVTTVTGCQFKIDGNITQGEAEVGSNSISDLIRGEIKVTGSFTAKFSATTIQDLYDNQSAIRLLLTVTDGSSGTADFIAFTMPAVKIFGDAADDGEAKEIIRTYPFVAQYYGAGGAGTADNQTILQFQDSQAV